eukprot:scaffold287249_cov33-Tisochrysis_lutea.AAC.1
MSSMPSLPPPSAPPLSPVGLGTPWIAGVVALELLLIYSASIALWLIKRRKGYLSHTTTEQLVQPNFCGASCSNGRVGRVALALWRLANLLVFSAYALADWAGCEFFRTWQNCELQANNEFPRAFTYWNYRLQPFYWAFVLLATILGSCSSCSSVPKLSSSINATAHGLLEVCVTSAWLVTIVVFTLLSPGHPSIFYDRYHFINTVCLTIEFAISRLDVRFGHFILMLSWMLLYVVFSWICRATYWNSFQYFFMELDDPIALMWYPVVALMNFVVYSIFVGISFVVRRSCMTPQASSDDKV